VALTPTVALSELPEACIVVDVLRATSSLVAMFGSGLDEAIVAPDIEAARAVAQEHRGILLCGERGGLPPAGFDYGNSPSEFARLDLTGRRAVLATTNGTRALQNVGASPNVFIGSLLNARATAEGVTSAGVSNVLIVCSGEARGTNVCLEDVYGAGLIVDRLTAMTVVSLADDASIAWRTYQSFSSAGEALQAARHARDLSELGLGADLEFCSQIDAYSIVPKVAEDSDALLRVSAGSSRA
jgi:2-phosphosulfolactate phosphatase